MKQKQLTARYLREMIGSLVLYALLLVCSIKFGRPMPEGVARTVFLFSPMAGFLAAIWTIARHVNGIDEYQRKFILETFAVGAALTAAITFSYGFPETAGYPKISMFSVWMIMAASWVLVGCGRALATR